MKAALLDVLRGVAFLGLLGLLIVIGIFALAACMAAVQGNWLLAAAFGVIALALYLGSQYVMGRNR